MILQSTNHVRQVVFARPECTYRLFSTFIALYGSNKRNDNVNDEEKAQIGEVRRWLSNLSAKSVPRERFESSFSRSSGPGGQNVNKLNTKATIRIRLDALGGWMPAYALQRLRNEKSRHISKETVLIQSDSSRSQRENLEECYEKFCELVRQSVHLPAEESAAETAAREEKWDKIRGRANEERMRAKKHRGEKLRSRRRGWDD
ncbi:hypothetical protein BZA70DRAFT_281110 [Myxozyma melibiosi]|uniref:Prokaryotic-type class I peptide chain release factors domain-containing protein n=1 Tax=Myxozyma melibiosi TaxID=54550 RepID=A0ABR1F406_9ASCO